MVNAYLPLRNLHLLNCFCAGPMRPQFWHLRCVTDCGTAIHAPRKSRSRELDTFKEEVNLCDVLRLCLQVFSFS